mmetsp:Transcript_23396/g.58068  ORF Transcript_23396/g.58068 Transcript_23396/m.58068 type:complete len:81 (-) Transcript_23396:246-488(-)
MPAAKCFCHLENMMNLRTLRLLLIYCKWSRLLLAISKLPLLETLLLVSYHPEDTAKLESKKALMLLARRPVKCSLVTFTL